jgi:NAD(P)-dependent dehydrogenase (short-subunit alcohol dehydrogenase family)
LGFSIELGERRALVTGGGQGVGRSIALALATAGAHVAVNDIVAERAEAVAEEVLAAGGTAEAAVFDVTDYASVADAVKRVGPVAILVNNAGNAGQEGWQGMTPFAETKPEDWERFVRINLYGVMNCTHAVLPEMIAAAAGRVVTVISDAGRYGDPNLAPYAAAKAGAAGFSRSVAREVGRHGITVNCVALATIRPPGSPVTDDQTETAKRQLSHYIIRRRGEPEDVANMVTFLASPLASWITGQTYPVNGGYTLSL